MAGGSVRLFGKLQINQNDEVCSFVWKVANEPKRWGLFVCLESYKLTKTMGSVRLFGKLQMKQKDGVLGLSYFIH